MRLQDGSGGPTAVPGERVIIVRHAMPAVDPDVPADRWPLAWASRVAARLVRLHVSHPAYYVASPEPKAVQTMQEIAGAQRLITDPDLAEVHRPHVWFTEEQDYQAAALAYAGGTCPEGWEPQAAVIARFDAAVVRHATEAAARRSTLVVGTHGLAPTVWMASRYELDREPARFWSELRFPDVVEIDLVRGRVTCLAH